MGLFLVAIFLGSYGILTAAGQRFFGAAIALPMIVFVLVLLSKRIALDKFFAYDSVVSTDAKSGAWKSTSSQSNAVTASGRADSLLRPPNNGSPQQQTRSSESSSTTHRLGASKQPVQQTDPTISTRHRGPVPTIPKALGEGLCMNEARSQLDTQDTPLESSSGPMTEQGTRVQFNLGDQLPSLEIGSRKSLELRRKIGNSTTSPEDRSRSSDLGSDTSDSLDPDVISMSDSSEDAEPLQEDDALFSLFNTLLRHVVTEFASWREHQQPGSQNPPAYGCARQESARRTPFGWFCLWSFFSLVVSVVLFGFFVVFVCFF